MKRSGRLTRYTPLKARRNKPRRGQPTAAEKRDIRLEVFKRALWHCELNLVADCNRGILPWDGSVFERGHLVHLHARRRFGWGMENLKLGCFACHSAMHAKGLKA